jgi:sister-chromatid-cohesion protein PDS5
MPIIYRSSLLIYNKSHVPAIVEISRNDEHGLGTTAHEFLKEISTRNPEVFKAHVKALCQSLEDRAPTAKKSNEAGAIDTLKACAGFARKFPKELPQEKRFLQSLMSFAQYGSPPRAAKHAVTILMATSEQKETNAKELLQKSLKGFKFGDAHFLSRLATLSQLSLLAPTESNEEADTILDLVLKEIIMKVRTPATDSDKEWAGGDDIDEEYEAKLWALKILVNRLRSIQKPLEAKEISSPVYQLLYTLILKEGELSKKGNTTRSQKSRLRLAAARLLLKLSTYKAYDGMLTAQYFNHLAYVAQDKNLNVRQGFINNLKKYIGQNKLRPRFYNIVFLLGFEPSMTFRESTTTWIRSRANALMAQKSTIMESNFARLLSLLAHHPDYSDNEKDLADFARYILFYLQTIAREENLGLIFHVAQQVKQTSDAIDPKKSDNLYHLSDLAQALIRKWEDAHGWSMQTWPGKLRLPSSLFANLPNHEIAQEIATRTYLPNDMGETLDGLVKAAVRLKTKKRKSEAHSEESMLKKRSKMPSAFKSKTLPYRKSTKPKDPKFKPSTDPTPSSERRTSSRVAHTGRMYAEQSDDEDDADMEKWDEREEEDEDEEGSEENDENEEDQEQEEAAKEDEMEIEQSPRPQPKPNGRSKAGTRTRKGRSAGKVQTEDLSDDDV